MKIVALAQQKGGVGKSTLAIHMAVELLRRKKKIAIVDMDAQQTATRWANRRGKDEPIVVVSDLPNLPVTLARLKVGKVDIALLDLPGQASPLANEGMRQADLVLVPTRPLDVDLAASAKTLDAAIRMDRPYAFVINSAPTRGARTADFVQGLAEHGQPVLTSIVVERFAYPDAIMEGIGVVEAKPPDSKAVEEIRSLVSEVLARIA